MANDQPLREHLLNLLRGNAGRRFETAMKDFPEDSMNVHPPNVDYTPWGLLEHLRYSLGDIAEYIRNPNYVNPRHPEDYWPPADQRADLAAWSGSMERYRADLKFLEEMVADPTTDLFAPMPNTPGHTIFREVGLVVGHMSYHIGEFGILRQVMGTWPADHR